MNVCVTLRETYLEYFNVNDIHYCRSIRVRVGLIDLFTDH